MMLGLLTVDAKASIMLTTESITEELGMQRVYAFGSVTTEQGPKTVKVASVVVDQQTINFWLHEQGFSKTTSLAPCAVWMCKAGFDEAKAMFMTGFDEASWYNFMLIHLFIVHLLFSSEAVLAVY